MLSFKSNFSEAFEICVVKKLIEGGKKKATSK